MTGMILKVDLRFWRNRDICFVIYSILLNNLFSRDKNLMSLPKNKAVGCSYDRNDTQGGLKVLEKWGYMFCYILYSLK